MKETKFNLHKQYLFGRLLSIQAKMIRRDQSTRSLQIKTTQKPSKVATVKIFFCSEHIMDATCFKECFPFQVITGTRCFSKKFIVTLRFFQPQYCCFLWNKCFERCRCFTLSPQQQCSANIKVPKQSYCTVYSCLINFRGYLFYDNLLKTLYFLTVSHYSL